MGIQVQLPEINVPEDDPFRNDLLDRKSSVKILTSIVRSIDSPCVISVDAPWGTGKTTFLRLWTQYLRNTGIPVVAFNAWETDFAGDPFVALSTELTESIEKYVESGDEDLKDLVGKVMRVAKKVTRRSLPILVQIASHGILDVEAAIEKIAAKTLSSPFEDKPNEYQKTRSALNDFRKALRDVTEKLTKCELSDNRSSMQIAVMIDELDRCRPTYAIEVLEIAKHIFAIEGIVFVLAVNRNALSHSIGTLYGRNFDANGYLRRFVDLEVRLPDSDQSKFVRTTLDQINLGSYFGRTKEHNAIVDKEEEIIRHWLSKAFASSGIEVRKVGQAIHHLGLVLASLRSDRRSFGIMATVALILRTIDPDLYHEFTHADCSDLEVVKNVFSNNLGLQRIQNDHVGCMFETMIILAGCEVSTYFNMPMDSPLFKQYSEISRDDSADRADKKHADKVLSRVSFAVGENENLYDIATQGEITRRYGFMESVRRLELISKHLVGNEKP